MKLFKMYLNLFKTVDEKFKEIGFNKIEESEHFVRYERYNEKYKYTQSLDLSYKNSGKHIVQSYDKDLLDTKGIGNTCVGLSMYEMKLCIKKMKQKGWKMMKSSINENKEAKRITNLSWLAKKI